MFNKSQWASIQKEMQKAGMFAEPSAAQKVMSVLQSAPEVAARLLNYLSAKQELKEMKNELSRMQTCVRELEAILEPQGPAACGLSQANQAFTNWMVSFAESYYALAMAFQAKNIMIPRVQAYLNGQRKKSFIAEVIDEVQHQQPPGGFVGAAVRQVLEQSMKNVPAFLKP